MIGRGSRILNNKPIFSVIDLGNNFHRFGPWGTNLDWQKIFRSPNYYVDNLLNDEDLELNFKYEMPKEILVKFSNSKDMDFNIRETYIDSVRNGLSSKVVLELSIAHHAKMCTENSEDVYDALDLAKLLSEDIDYRISHYTKCISKSTNNFVNWLKEDYQFKLRTHLRKNFDTIYEEIHGKLPE